MATFIYVPVSTPEMTGFVQDWNNGRQARGKAAYQVIANDSSGTGKELRRKFGTGFLEQVTAGDKLYVLAHGILSPTSGGRSGLGTGAGAISRERPPAACRSSVASKSPTQTRASPATWIRRG